MERLKEGSASGVLTVAISPAFAAKWLLPRIESFQAACPDTDVRLDTNLKPVNFVAQQVDIGVRYGTGSWPMLVAANLMDEEVYPVCNSAILRPRKSQRKQSDFAREIMIHDLSMDDNQGR